jgi:nicotinamidase-related amidase
MPLTKVDAITALVLIDLQKGVVGMQMAHPVAQIVDRAARLARAFREKKRPVVLVNVSGVAPGRTEAAPPDRPQ